MRIVEEGWLKENMSELNNVNFFIVYLIILIGSLLSAILLIILAKWIYNKRKK